MSDESGDERREPSNAPLPDEHIVEVYVAANALEAYGLAEALEERGISAKVVNEQIGQAGGALPLGWVASPRVWVHASDRMTAERLILEWSEAKDQAEAAATDDVDDFGDESSEAMANRSLSDEEQSDESPLRNIFAWLLQLAGGFILLMGFGYALITYVTNRRLSAETQADLTRVDHQFTSNGKIFRPQSDGAYSFVVEGRKYAAHETVHSRYEDAFPPVATVHYNPRDPRHNLVGELPSPWPPLVAAACVGGLMIFIGLRTG